MTEAEYLAWAGAQDERYEYSAGYVYARSGGSVQHSTIAASIPTPPITEPPTLAPPITPTMSAVSKLSPSVAAAINRMMIPATTPMPNAEHDDPECIALGGCKSVHG